MKRRTSTALFLLLYALAVLSACAQAPTTGQNAATGVPAAATSAPAAAAATAAPDAPAAALTFPEAFPTTPKAVDPSVYAYDDLSQKYTIEILVSGVFNQASPRDPIKEYLDEQLNVDLKLTTVKGDDLQNTIATRFAAGEPPDLIMVPKDIALTLFEQGQTADATAVLPYMPQAAQYVTEQYAKWATVDGQMIGVPRYPVFPDNWGLFIRSDWLDTLGMSAPTTEDELFAYAQAVVSNDPNGNGKADEYFMATGGDGNGWTMMNNLLPMYGHPGWNVADGKINHPMLDGTTKRFLEYIKKLNDAKLLAPDWYTTAWEPLKALTYNDQLGAVTYPGWNLATETVTAKQADQDDVATASIWEPLQPLKSNDGRGGNYAPGGAPGGLFVFSARLAEDEGKLKRVAHLLDTLIYPNQNYWAASQGGGPEVWPDEGIRVALNPDGTNVFFIPDTSTTKQPDYTGLQDWQWLGYSLVWQVYDDPVGSLGSEWNQEVIAMPRYQNYDIFLTLDGPTTTKLNDFQLENEIQFVLGTRSFDEWDAYVEEWKAAGGQELLEQAAEQLQVAAQ